MRYLQKVVDLTTAQHNVVTLDEGSFYAFRTLVLKKENTRTKVLIPNVDFTIVSLMHQVRVYQNPTLETAAQRDGVCQAIIFAENITGEVTIITYIVDGETENNARNIRNAVSSIINEAIRSDTLNEALDVTRGLTSYLTPSYTPLVNPEYKLAGNFNAQFERERGGLSWGKVQLAVQGLTKVMNNSVDDISKEYTSGVMKTMTQHFQFLKMEAEREIEDAYRVALSTRLSDKQLVHTLNDSAVINNSYKIGNVVLQGINQTGNDSSNILLKNTSAVGFNGALRKDSTIETIKVNTNRIEFDLALRNENSKQYSLYLDNDKSTDIYYHIAYNCNETESYTMFFYSATAKKIIKQLPVRDKGTTGVSKAELQGLLRGVATDSMLETILVFLHNGVVDDEYLASFNIADKHFASTITLEVPLTSAKTRTTIGTYPHTSMKLLDSGFLEFHVTTDAPGIIRVETFNSVNTLLSGYSPINTTNVRITEDMVGRQIHQRVRIVNNTLTDIIPEIKISVLTNSGIAIDTLTLSNPQPNYTTNIQSYKVVCADSNLFEGGVIIDKNILNIIIYTDNAYTLRKLVTVTANGVTLTPIRDVVEPEHRRYILTFNAWSDVAGIKEFTVRYRDNIIGTPVCRFIKPDYPEVTGDVFRAFTPSDITFHPVTNSGDKALYMLRLQRLNPASYKTSILYNVDVVTAGNNRVKTRFVMSAGQEFAYVRLELPLIKTDAFNHYGLIAGSVIEVWKPVTATGYSRAWTGVVPDKIGSTKDYDYIIWNGKEFNEFIRLNEPFQIHLRNNTKDKIGLTLVDPHQSDNISAIDAAIIDRNGVMTQTPLTDLNSAITLPTELAGGASVNISNGWFIIRSIQPYWSSARGSLTAGVFNPRIGIVRDGVIRRMSEYDEIPCLNAVVMDITNILTGTKKLRAGMRLQSLEISSNFNHHHHNISCLDSSIAIWVATGVGNYSSMTIVNLVDTNYMSRRSGDKITLFITNSGSNQPGYSIDLEYE